MERTLPTEGAHTFTWNDSTPLEIVRLQRDTPGHAALFAKVIDRMTRFSESMGVGVGAAPDQIWKSFAERSPLLGLWVAHRGGVIEAHLHADVRPWNGENVGWIAQAKVDDPNLFRLGQIDAVLEDVMTWLKSVNVAFPQLDVRTVLFATFRQANVWKRRYGFTPHATILQRRLV